MITDEALIGDQLVKIYTSRYNKNFESEQEADKGVTITSGPTVFVFRSGAFRIVHGAYIRVHADDRITIYAQ